jgi:hypothetical protein
MPLNLNPTLRKFFAQAFKPSAQESTSRGIFDLLLAAGNGVDQGYSRVFHEI